MTVMLVSSLELGPRTSSERPGTACSTIARSARERSSRSVTVRPRPITTTLR